MENSQTVTRKAKRKRYSLEFKAKIVLYYRSIQSRQDKSEKSIRYINRKTSIDIRTLGDWIKKGDQIIQSLNKRESRNLIDSAKYSCICEPMELELKEWINNQRAAGKCVSGTLIMQESVKVFNLIHSDPSRCPDPLKRFSGSRGWFKNFCKRRGFVLRRVSSTGRDLPYNVVDVCNNFFREV
jgi:hypothetical protein